MTVFRAADGAGEKKKRGSGEWSGEGEGEREEDERSGRDFMEWRRGRSGGVLDGKVWVLDSRELAVRGLVAVATSVWLNVNTGL